MPRVRVTECRQIPSQVLRLHRPPYEQNAYVRLAQEDLRRLGFNPGKVDGQYGPETERAVRAFQSRYAGSETPRGRIAVDGVVGPATWCLLLDLAAGVKPVPITAPPTRRPPQHRPSVTTRRQGYVPPSIPAQTLPQGTVGQAYNYTLLVRGGTSPYRWYVTAGTLPPGLTLSTSGTLSGTPSAAGQYSITVEVIDRHDRTSSQTLRLGVATGQPPGVKSELLGIVDRIASTLHVRPEYVEIGGLALIVGGAALVATREKGAGGGGKRKG